jgi:hypothetical protein
MLEEVYGRVAMTKTLDCEWHERIRDGCASVIDDTHCRRPSDSINDENIENVRNVERINSP